MSEYRVGAILDSDNEVCRFLGYGVYEGNFVPDENAGGLAALCLTISRPNPRIRLDNGDVVWGGECWWGSEDAIRTELEKKRTAGIQVVEVRIADARKTERSS